MQIPQVPSLGTHYFARVFDNTIATYKFYWLLAILDLFVKQGKTRMNVWELSIKMVTFAWYPVNYFRLSFGKSESLYNAILQLQKENDIPINLNASDLTVVLNDLLEHKEIRNQLFFLQLNVPYRFLRPWIDTSNDNEMMMRSQSFENNCLYKLEKIDKTLWIELNPAWLSYLQTNYTILRDFSYWNLTLFLQARNPNVPNIPNKLIKQESRNSLTQQRLFWNTVMKAGDDVQCIYTGKPLSVGNYDLDHFIPWSFVSHDLLWNLMPADSSINSSKNNKLPDLKEYLPKLATAHQKALMFYIRNLGKTNNKILEDYLSLGCTAQDIIEMDTEHLIDCFNQTFTPMTQIATNMGFEHWKFKNR